MYLLLVCVFIVFIVLSDNIGRCVGDTLHICAVSVVPSLFPFMVISSLLTRCAPYIFSESRTHLPFSSLPLSAGIAPILGSLCGFPVGIITTAGLKKNGLITKKEAERLAAISNNTGPAFVAEVIGQSFLGSRRIGWTIYFIQIGVAFVLGIFLLPKKKRETVCSVRCAYPRLSTSEFTNFFNEAISSSVTGILKICGYIVFFSTVVQSLSLLFTEIPEEVSAVFTSILEFTSGCRRAASLEMGKAAPICAFAVGFSGLSVFAQGFGYANEAGFSLRLTLAVKFFCGVICGFVAYLII